MSEVVVNPLKEDGTPKTPEEIAQERADKGLPPEPGSKTDSALLLKSLQEEREKRRLDAEKIEELTQKITELETALSSPDIISDEGKALKKEIDDFKIQIGSLTRDVAFRDVLIDNPVIKEHKEEFEKFLADPENAGMSLKTATKAFLTERGLSGDSRRPGLERTTGGGRQTPNPVKMSLEEITHLRQTNFKQYLKLLEQGLIQP